MLMHRNHPDGPGGRRRRTIIFCGVIVVSVLALGWLILRPGTPDRDEASGAGRAPATRPNVLLISLDTLRPDHLGCYGYPRDTSPHLDQFARSAVQFTNARAQAPWTLPSHMSLFTSQLPSRNRVYDLNHVLPEGIPTLAQILQENGYHTVGLVNDGQMKAHWGFNRGFAEWREFGVDTPAGNCENITREAINWLANKGKKPFFMFLHYFDVHEPYAAAEAFRQKFEVQISGPRSSRLMWAARYPGQALDPGAREQLINAYDAEIAWLDDELGKLFGKVPENTLVVLFSDHGELFGEHGWTLHGATLYEAEIRVLLLMKYPGRKWAGRKIGSPVMLLDVAPTVLAACGIRQPAQFDGRPINLEADATPSHRMSYAETTRMLEGRVLKSVMRYPWKLTYSLFDGELVLHKLPDEERNLMTKEKKIGGALLRELEDWLAIEDCTIVYAKGSGRYELTVKLPRDKILTWVPIDIDHNRDSIEVLADGAGLRVTFFLREQTKGLYLEFTHQVNAVSFDFKINEERDKKRVFISSRRSNPESLPFELSLGPDRADADPRPAHGLIKDKFSAARLATAVDGFYLVRYPPGRPVGSRPKPRRGRTGRLDEETIRRLKALGYMQ